MGQLLRMTNDAAPILISYDTYLDKLFGQSM